MKLGPAVAVAMLLCASPLFAAPCVAADAAQQRGTLPALYVSRIAVAEEGSVEPTFSEATAP